MRFKAIFSDFLILSLLLGSFACTKLVKIPEPLSTVTTTETFATTAKANSALAGIYNNMMTTGCPGAQLSADAGMSADELNYFGSPNLFQENLLSSTSSVSDIFWTTGYYNVYQANAAIEGLQASTTLTATTKAELTGEAKFLRAFCNFYLVNLYGDVPLLLSTSYSENSLMSRTPKADVYLQIIEDLKQAQAALRNDYSAGNGERIRANSWAATALLARVYLYTGKWDSAEAQSTAIINDAGDFMLVTDLDSISIVNNTEAILQLQQSYNSSTGTSATTDGYTFNPYDENTPPAYYLTDQLLLAFEPNDLRRIAWVDSVNFDDGTGVRPYYYPYKYKIRTTTADDITEYTVILRLAEQYLIRAEARAHQNNGLQGAIDDLNVIRSRAGLPALNSTLTQSQVLAAVTQERRIEFFGEFGHRWLDLHRTSQADAVLKPIKPNWVPTAILYPIPFSEIQTDPNLTQNPGYN